MQLPTSDDHLQSGQVVAQSTIQGQLPDSDYPDKDGKQVSPPNEQNASGCLEITHSLATKLDSMVEQDHLLVSPLAATPSIPSPEDQSTDLVEPRSVIEQEISSSHESHQHMPGELYPTQDHNDDALDPNTKLTPIVQRRKEVLYDRVPNIVIFGETGVGKSSIINLIADKNLADTSNDAVGCTFQHERYPITLGGVSCALWDTAGLDEGTEGTVPAEVAEENLKELMRALARSGGIHLIIYCIRGTRLTKALKRNYDLFYVAVCRKQVPAALVVTGLEHQLGEMESWWDKNEAVLMQRYGMQFDAHACVTTLEVDDPAIRQRRLDSQTRLRELVVEYCRQSGWAIDSSFMSLLPASVRSILRGISSRTSPRNKQIIRKVAICDSFSNDRCTSSEQTEDGNCEFIRVAKSTLQRSRSYRSANVGLLLFYASPLVDHQIPLEDIDALKLFYKIMGGQPRRVVIILRGCDDLELARAWSELTSSQSIRAHTHFLPRALNDTPGKLDEIIERWYPSQHIEDKGSSFFGNVLSSFCFNGSGPVDDLSPPVSDTGSGQHETSRPPFLDRGDL